MHVDVAMMKLLALSILVFATTACTNATTQSSVIAGLNLTAPTVNSSTTPLIIIPYYNSPVSISGTCTQLTILFQMSYDGGLTWGGLPSGATVNCATTGTFSFNITDASTLGIPNGLTSSSLPGVTEAFQLRSTTPLGNTGVAVVTLSLPPAYNSYLASLPSAGGTMSGTHYKITGKFGSAVSKPTLTGSTYNVQLETSN
jgi:hypothetical protein